MGNKVALAYLARGADADWRTSIERFATSYARYATGVDHTFYLILKGFQNVDEIEKVKSRFSGTAFVPIEVADDSFDIGAYIASARQMDEDYVCFLNTASEAICDLWLQKLLVNLETPGTGLVGATGSFESIHDYNPRFPVFPNLHLRSNAFMLRRKLFLEISAKVNISSKLDAFLFESGPESLTRRILGLGLRLRLVGRNGRGYGPRWWPVSQTFRQGRQENLLVADNQTRNFDRLRWPEKHAFVHRTWGHYLQEQQALAKAHVYPDI